MATAQTSKSSTADRNKKGQRSGTRESDAQTVERDETYNLVSVLYHALQGVETLAQYQKDAKSDDELSQFFEETRNSYALVAQQAKALLGERIDAGDDDDDDEDDDDAEA